MAGRPPPRIFSPAAAVPRGRVPTRQASPEATRSSRKLVDDMIERLQFTRLAPEARW